MINSITFIDKNNVNVIRDSIKVDQDELRKLNFAILESYVSEEMRYFKSSLPKEKLEITSLMNGFDQLNLKYSVIDPHDKDSILQLQDVDFAFLNLYGEYGEDGRVQGMLDLLKVKYNGPGVIGSALFIDKLIAKVMLRSQGHLTADFNSERVKENNSLNLPAMLKTYRGGSSVRMQYIGDKIPDEIEDDCFVEEFIDGRLLTVSILENAGDIFILPVLEVITNESKFYDDKSKVNRTTTYEFPTLSDKVKLQLSSLVADSYNLMDLRNCGRIDYILKDDELWYLETNTIPGILNKGNFALCFKQAGIEYDEMLSLIISSALNKKAY